MYGKLVERGFSKDEERYKQLNMQITMLKKFTNKKLFIGLESSAIMLASIAGSEIIHYCMGHALTKHAILTHYPFNENVKEEHIVNSNHTQLMYPFESLKAKEYTITHSAAKKTFSWFILFRYINKRYV